MRTSPPVLPIVRATRSENTTQNTTRKVVQYFREDPDRIVGWWMLVVVSVGQISFGIFW